MSKFFLIFYFSCALANMSLVLSILAIRNGRFDSLREACGKLYLVFKDGVFGSDGWIGTYFVDQWIVRSVPQPKPGTLTVWPPTRKHIGPQFGTLTSHWRKVQCLMLKNIFATSDNVSYMYSNFYIDWTINAPCTEGWVCKKTTDILPW